jgi:hypothetical protein
MHCLLHGASIAGRTKGGMNVGCLLCLSVSGYSSLLHGLLTPPLAASQGKMLEILPPWTAVNDFLESCALRVRPAAGGRA